MLVTLRPDADRHRGVQPRPLRRGQPLRRRPPLHADRRRHARRRRAGAARPRTTAAGSSSTTANNHQNIDPTRYPQGGLSASNTLRVGDTPARADRRHGLPLQRLPDPADRAARPGATTTRAPPAPEPVGGNLKVASFNVLNYFNGDGLGGGFPTPRGANTPVEFDAPAGQDRQRAHGASTPTSSGSWRSRTTRRPTARSRISSPGSTRALGAGTYAFVDTGVIGTDEIKVALIYKPASVSPVGAFDDHHVGRRPALRRHPQPAVAGADVPARGTAPG